MEFQNPNATSSGLVLQFNEKNSVELCMNFRPTNLCGFVCKTENFGRDTRNSEAGGNSDEISGADPTAVISLC